MGHNAPAPARRRRGARHIVMRAYFDMCDNLMTCIKTRGGDPIGLASEAALHQLRLSEISVPLDMALADNLPAAVDEVEFPEFFVLVFEIDGPIAASGGGGISAPG